MRSTTTAEPFPTAPTGPPAGDSIEAIVGGLHQMIGSLRCAGTGRMVKAGISMTHLHILWVLDHHGDLTMGRLAELLDVSLSNASGLIDRMEERGLVERVRVPNDRRVVLVRSSAEGNRIRDEIEALKQDRIRSILGRLGPDQLDRLADAIRDLSGAVLADVGSDHLDAHTHLI
ncbi:MAG TPA: MarR family transcriptional regulator [Candidatus Deferrimicrobium sp.]|nr:MarR family transcriptional regulator [Candidatus Deferrimicrobium sp.]